MRSIRAVLAIGLLAGVAAAVGSGEEFDSWSSLVSLTGSSDGDGLSSIHGMLLPDGRVLLMGLRRLPGADLITDRRQFIVLFTPTPAGEAPPASVSLPYQTVPYVYNQTYVNGTSTLHFLDDIFHCGGHILTSGGEAFVLGGERLIRELDPQTMLQRSAYVLGVPYGLRFKPGSNTWNPAPVNFLGADPYGNRGRWYPTATRLAHGRILIAGGYGVLSIVDSNNLEIQDGIPNRSVELWTPATGAQQLLSTDAESPYNVWNRDYTHAWQLPHGRPGKFDVVMIGEYGTPMYLSLQGPVRWDDDHPIRPEAPDGSSPVAGASSLLLPLRINNGQWGYANGSFLCVGGGDMPGPHMDRIDLYDTGADRWRDEPFMLNSMRHHPSTVLLPNGQIVVFGGHHMDSDKTLLHYAEYIDPRAGFDVSLGTAPMSTTRGYHTVGLLLPDGRVLVAGGRTSGSTGPKDEQPNLEYLYPPYMNQPRPSLTSAPLSITYGSTFNVSFSGATQPEFVLLAPGSMTHSFDQSQRYVQLAVTALNASAGTATLAAPLNAQVAPQADYMLFVVSERGAPSVARFVHLEGGDSDGDGLVDGSEAPYGTDPTDPDTDGDGLSDGAEILTHHTDPLKADTDGDGYTDGVEVNAGSDPMNAASIPVWRVDRDNVSPIKDGKTWATAFSTLQPAIDKAATAGGDVWVAKGTYSEARTAVIDGVNTGALALKPGIRVYGGFIGIGTGGNESTVSQRNVTLNVTTIDGSKARGGLAAYHTILGAAGAVLDGFRITGGNANGAPATSPALLNSGGGMLNYEVYVSVANCTFAGNKAAYGGGLANWGSSASVTNCTFTAGTAEHGAGAFNLGSSPTFTGCTFKTNTASAGAGGLENNGASAKIINSAFTSNRGVLAGGLVNQTANGVTVSGCTFKANSGYHAGALSSWSSTQGQLSGCVLDSNGATVGAGGIFSSASSVSVQACTIRKNVGGYGGGVWNMSSYAALVNTVVIQNRSSVGSGLFNSQSTVSSLINCTIAGNTSNATGSGIRNEGSSRSTILNGILWANTWPSGSQSIYVDATSTATATYSDVQGGYAGTGNINADPKFVNVSGLNYTLNTGSPCIDHGTATGAPATDRDGVTRPQGAGFDMGAYERRP